MSTLEQDVDKLCQQVVDLGWPYIVCHGKEAGYQLFEQFHENLKFYLDNRYIEMKKTGKVFGKKKPAH